MKNQIITVRYLYAGGATMGVGDEAFICYQRGGELHWVYAVLIRLTERTAWICPKYNSCKSDVFRVHPNEIVKITDKDVPSE